jgi:hypothetical protein
MDVSNVLFRLKKAIAYLKGQQKIHNQQDIVNALGYNKSSVSQALNNRKNYLTEDFVKKFCKTFDINHEWILFGIGNMLLENNPYKEADFYSNPILSEPNNERITTENPSKLTEGKKLYYTDCKVIPCELLDALKETTYNEVNLQNLKSERITLIKQSAGKWFKIEIKGASMSSNANTSNLKENLCDGSWAYCKTIAKSNWKNKLTKLAKVQPCCFFHNTKGILVRNVAHFDAAEEKLTLQCNHPNKESYPDIEIRLEDCSVICEVVKVLVYI